MCFKLRVAPTKRGQVKGTKLRKGTNNLSLSFSGSKRGRKHPDMDKGIQGIQGCPLGRYEESSLTSCLSNAIS